MFVADLDLVNESDLFALYDTLMRQLEDILFYPNAAHMGFGQFSAYGRPSTAGTGAG